MPSINQLREIPIFACLESEEVSALAQILQERRVSKNSVIMCASDPGSSIMFILKGKTRVALSSSEGKEIVLSYLNQGEFFGEIAVLTGADRSADVIALTDCEVLVLQKDDFESHIQNHSGLVLGMMTELAERLRAASAKIADLALYDVYRRISRTLNSIAENQEINGEVRLVIEQRPTHQELAAMTGTSREMVTRALKGLEEDGCISIEEKKIIIHKKPI